MFQLTHLVLDIAAFVQDQYSEVSQVTIDTTRSTQLSAPRSRHHLANGRKSRVSCNGPMIPDTLKAHYSIRPALGRFSGVHLQSGSSSIKDSITSISRRRILLSLPVRDIPSELA